MQIIDVTQTAAHDLVANIAVHLPPGASMGRVRCVLPAGVLADDDGGAPVLYGLDAGSAWRLTGINSTKAEVVTWRGGKEIGRRLIDG